MRWLVFVMGLALSPTMAGAEMYKGHETPGYSVLRTVAEAEIRDYPAQLVAEVTAQGSRSGAAGDGFRALAGYIFGGNDTGARIAMTTPVAQAPQPQVAQGWTVRFMMPADWTRQTLPQPANPAVRLTEIAPRRLIVLRFSGQPTDRALREAETRLRAIAADAGIRLQGAVEFLFYDSPFTLPARRRNEVAFPVD